ncbi:hypothetical protein HXZ91_17565 [Myroides odoratimimus]|uniref:5-methylcytosine restriction system specificity protein McrC n=1 Tax=Myroides odoratimimus TaxID=76832 RepID=UPI0025784D31|nr:hypothetical protein [Myroides odoratimimus]MDM1036258.1 hypothetical protein [Myroides odoratimimus]
MPILRIRENFSTQFHQVSSIQNYDSKWKDVLWQKMEALNEFRLDCNKLSKEVSCIHVKKTEDKFEIETSYLIGLDYIYEDVPLLVEPKFSHGTDDYSVDFYKILFDSLPYIKSNEVISDLYYVNFEGKTIEIEQKDDFLTPIIVIQFLNSLKKICRSGLQKGYYIKEDNLNEKVKGKILIKETIKRNHLNANFSKTYCQYQEFGFNTKENQFLKFAFQFCLNYLNQFKQLDLFQNIENTIGIIRSAMSSIDLVNRFRKELVVSKNPLFPEYEKAIGLANLILKRNAFNITNTTANKVKTYPYWINMSKLFELHVVKLLRMSFPNGVIFQKEYAGRIPDIVLNTELHKAVIDVKYKDYSSRSMDNEDIRQVAAYTRMKGVFKELQLQSTNVLDGIIIYPKVASEYKTLDSSVLRKKIELDDYYNIFKLEVEIPVINKTN